MARTSDDRLAEPSATEADVYRAVRAHEIMLNEATAAFEHAALAPLFLLNGGAAVAFLTLLGATSSNESRFDVESGWAVAAVGCWALGLLAGLMATLCCFGIQRAHSKAHRLQRQQIERQLLGDSPLADIVARINPDVSRDDELRTARTLTPRLSYLLALGTGCFLLGTAAAAVAVI